MKKFIQSLILFGLLGTLACTDARCSKVTNLGNGATITCYSGGKLLGTWESTGKVASEANSDGYFFKDKKSGDLMEVSGNCIINYR